MKTQGSAKPFTSSFKEIIRSIIPFGDEIIFRFHDEVSHKTMYRVVYVKTNSPRRFQ